MSFNQFKNHTQILKKYITKMNSITQSQIKPQWIQQSFLKQNNPHIFLQILHYILIKFSPYTLFVKVLDYYPTIKDDNDKKFITNLMTLARKMFDIDVKIDIDQFLSSKFVQKKTEFTSLFCKAAFQYHLKQTKSSSNSNSISSNNINKKQNDLSSNVPSKLVNKYTINDDSDDQMPRNLNVAPSTTKRIIVNKQDSKQSSSDQDLKDLINKKKQLNKIKQKIIVTNKPNTNINMQTNIAVNENKKGNIFPKNVKIDQNSDNEFNQVSQNRFEIEKTIGKFQQNNYKQPNKQAKPAKLTIQTKKQSSLPIQQNNYPEFDPSQYVTRQQFMQIVTGMTRNFTQLLTKFNDFQTQVGGWVQNVNAKISILQENVKTIKNNL